ncbi:MAG: DUF5685 family protein [Planctomycetota bacterium]|nr:DUF5685 family protein [Planctomycetota bacterium]
MNERRSAMFGFLRGPPCDREYRQIYAGLCDFQRRNFGLESLPFLSYEATFLYQFAVDTGDCTPPPAGSPPCCRLGIRQSAHHVDPILAEYCSSFGMLLASIKLNDDVRECHRLWNGDGCSSPTSVGQPRTLEEKANDARVQSSNSSDVLAE